MQHSWLGKAELYEMLSLGYGFYPRETVEAVVSGEYGKALSETLESLGFGGDLSAQVESVLASYAKEGVEDAFHRLRREYTRLFVGSPTSLVSPYTCVYYAEDVKVQPLLYVNKESMAVERFMRECGMGRPEGTNDPLDHIGTELEFLSYLCLDRAGVINAEGNVVPADAYEVFYQARFAPYAKRIARLVVENTDEPLLRAVSAVVAELPEEAL